MDGPMPRIPHTRSTKMRWGVYGLMLAVGLILLGSVRFPGSHRGMASRVTVSALQAQGVWKACRLYAEEHEGRFPVGREGATHAFRELVAGGYVEDEKPFYVPGSAWHDEAPNQKPDNDIGTRPDFARALERGENHWAYVSGLTADSEPRLPLIADGFVQGKPGQYTDDPTKKGGVWKGTKAIVVYVSGEVKAENLSSTSGFRVLKPKPGGPGTTPPVDIFTPEGGLPPGARVLNPW